VSGSSGNPVIVQSDKTVLLEVDNPLYESARDQLARFAELEKSPEYVHTYRISPLSLWNGAATGLDAQTVLDALERYSKYPIPDNVRIEIADYIARYGRVTLVREDGALFLTSQDQVLLTELARDRRLMPFILERVGPSSLRVDPLRRGHIKQALMHIGYPAEDLAGYVEGTPLSISLCSTSGSGEPFALRRYQQQAVDAFYASGAAHGGSGVVVLPCGAGKTIVGIGVIEKLQQATLILTTSTVASRQWISEILDKTDLDTYSVGEYTGSRKQVRPITVSTYQIMTYRPRHNPEHADAAQYPHFALFDVMDWGLIIYDEVHLLPAPVFRITAEIQARRRLGLTATLVREDHRERDVFSLIGPKKYDAPWKELEQQGWIATAECHEIRVALPNELRLEYALAEDRAKYRLAAENPRKLEIVDQLLAKHPHDSVLIIGMYLSQLRETAERFGFPLITGSTSVSDREQLFERFRSGSLERLIVSKVGNFAIDLPDANVAIQISGTFGSRQEEAQRLGRLLRPKQHGLLAHFYSLVSRDTRDQEYAARRQLFLTEQGYRYDIIYEDELPGWHPTTLALEARQVAPRALSSGG
jgi:DNA excision repair protein ERCC-3